MSSFVVDKKEFVKAAGLLHGIEETRRHEANSWFLDHVLDEFYKCYYLNVASVNDQYDSNEEPETEWYLDVFEEYCEKGRSLWKAPDDRKRLRTGLMKFFQSVLYQIENKDAAVEVSAVFFGCIQVIEIYRTTLDTDWWGEIGV
jgi:hypothetical protein